MTDGGQMDHEKRAEEMEATEGAMEERSDELEQRIEETKGDWEAKVSDAQVPGAQSEDDLADVAPGDEEAEGAEGSEAAAAEGSAAKDAEGSEAGADDQASDGE
jgi:hypothetical protein